MIPEVPIPNSWRKLKPTETVEAGDKFYWAGDNLWHRVSYVVGMPAHRVGLTIARKLKSYEVAPTPILPSVPSLPQWVSELSETARLDHGNPHNPVDSANSLRPSQAP